MLIALLGLVTGPRIQAQQNKAPDFVQYLDQNPWDAQKRGPMLVLRDPVPLTSQEPGLAAYGRMEAKTGGITAIVPSEMVLIDDSLKEPPNLYDGLPRADKLIYLMSLMDSHQWEIACSEGIGLGDLNQNEQAVFRSILPSTFTYNQWTLGEKGVMNPPSDAPAQVTLTPQEEAGVRIHFYRQIELGVYLKNGGHSGASAQMSDEYKPGSQVLTRVDSAAEDHSLIYGVRVRKVEPNKLKPSDLDYRSHSLDTPINLTATSKVSDLCGQLSGVTGLKIVADPRVAPYVVQTAGASARAGDVLQALALMFTGTFRKVENLYILTYDREGIGTKRLRLACWKSALDFQTQRRSEEWKRAIQATGNAKYVRSPDGNPLPGNQAMEDFMASNEDQGDRKMPAGELTPQWQSILNRSTRFFQPGSLRTDVAEPFSNLVWQFRLSDGRDLWWENGGVFGLSSLRPPVSKPNDYRSHTPVKPTSIPANGSALVVRCDDPGIVLSLESLAAKHGFSELWLESRDADCIQTAVGGPIKVRLFIEPWADDSGTDRSLLGESFPAAFRSVEATPDYQEMEEVWGLAEPIKTGLMAPGERAQSNAWEQMAKLSHIPGLAGCVLRNTEPPGYEPTIDPAEYWPQFLAYPLDQGYSSGLRTKLIESKGVDPIDLIEARFSTLHGIDLTLPFFMDPEQRGFGDLVVTSEPGGSFLKWIQIRTGANQTAVTQLANSLPGPVFFEPRNNLQDMPLNDTYSLVQWTPGSPLPTTAQPPDKTVDQVPNDGYQVFRLSSPMTPATSSRLFDILQQLLKSPKAMFAADLTAVPVEDLPKALNTWFLAGQ